jgi:hypothetical protein
MATIEGEEVLDALLVLGYTVEIADDGAIIATNGHETLRGKAAIGTIGWPDRSSIRRMLERAYIVRLRKHVQARPAALSQARHVASTEPTEGVSV